MNPDQGTELRSGKVIHSSSGTSSAIDSDMAQSSANDSDNNETSDISSQLSEIKENYERKINELQSEFSQLKNLLMAVISKNDENNLPSTTQSFSKPTHRVGFDRGVFFGYFIFQSFVELFQCDFFFFSLEKIRRTRIFQQFLACSVKL